MSDEEDEYEYDEDMDEEEQAENDNDDDDEEEQFEYTDEEEDADDDKVALENAYYNAKGLRDIPSDAAQAFEKVIAQEAAAAASTEPPSSATTAGVGSSSSSSSAQWTFKCLKQLVKLQFKTGNATELVRHYKRLLDCVPHVSPNAVEKGISGMLERISSLYQGTSSLSGGGVGRGGGAAGVSSTAASCGMADPQGLAIDVYNCTLRIFHPKTGSFPNERLWFKTNLKYGQLLYERNETTQLQAVLRDLQTHHHRSSSSSTGGDGSSSTPQQSLEIYALQIQLYSRQKDHKRLRETYSTAMSVVAGSLPHPRTLALIQELGGKMYMAGKEYGPAEKSFFQAFKSYDEAGDVSRLRCLKYLVLASMLHASTINPFDSQEARPYRDDPEIVALTNLVQAFHANDIAQFEHILRTKQNLMQDEFVRQHMEDLLRTIRRQVLKKGLQPYSRISLSAIAHQFLNDIPVSDVESLLVGMILDDVLPARLDRVDGILYNYGHTQTSQGSSTNPDSHTTSSKSETKEKLQAVESLVDLLSRMNDDLATTMANTSSVHAGGGRGGSSSSGGSFLRGTGMMMMMH